MAKLLVTYSPRLATIMAVVAIVFLACFGASAAAAAEQPRGFLQSQRPAPKLGRQKLSHFRVYWHDILSGRNPTTVQVAQATVTNRSLTAFGGLYMIDDPLTERPELSSKLVGRAQGMYASASQSEVGLLMAMNFAFMEGKYNGSTITILGRNSVLTQVREMPVIGGSGLFRFARGYCQARTYKLDFKTGDAVVEYNIFVMHY